MNEQEIIEKLDKLRKDLIKTADRFDVFCRDYYILIESLKELKKNE